MNTALYNDKVNEIIRDAVQGQRCVRMRQEILYNNEHKVKASVELVKHFNLKTITFAQSTKFVDDVKEVLGTTAVAYHSYLKPENRMVEKTKVYKTLSGLTRAIKKNPDKKYRQLPDSTFQLYWKEPKKFGVDSLKKDAILRFSNNRYKVNVICTAKALDQGFDVK